MLGGCIVLVTLAGATCAWLQWSEATPALQWRAQRGSAFAAFELGLRLEAAGETGKALRWFETAVAEDHPEAMHAAYRIAQLSHPERARHWLEALAQSGDPESQRELAHLLESENAFDAALEWWAKAARNGNASAAWEAGRRQVEAGPDSEQFKRGERYIRFAAESGVADAMFWLGEAHKPEGALVSSSSLSQRWLNQAASVGHVEASYEVGRIFAKRARERAERIYAQERLNYAYDKGLFEAAGPLGDLAQYEGNLESAITFYAIAALKGDLSVLPSLLRILQRQSDAHPALEDLWYGWEVFYRRQTVPGKDPRRDAPFLDTIHLRRGAYVADQLEKLNARLQAISNDPRDEVQAFLRASPRLISEFTSLGLEELYTNAVTGSGEACYALAEQLRLGTDGGGDLEEAAFWYSRAADAGFAEAAWKAYAILGTETDPAFDPAQADLMLRRAAFLDHPEAVLLLAKEAMANGNASSDNLAVSYLLRAETRPEAKELLRELIIDGRSVAVQNTKLHPYLLELSEEGHAEPLYQLGILHWTQQGDTPEAREESRGQAIGCWLRAADLGHLRAAVRAAKTLAHSATDLDEPMITRLLELAATQDHPEAIFLLGARLLEQEFDEDTLSFATDRIRRAAELGHPQARTLFLDLNPEAADEEPDLISLSLVDLYYQATNVGTPEGAFALAHYVLEDNPHDNLIEMAMDWMEEAAMQGHIPAYLALSSHYLRGDHVEPDPLRSLRWLEAAAEAGNAEAQYGAGLRYVQGEIVARDPQRAKAFFEAAAAQGHEEAQASLVSLGNIESRGVARSTEEAVQVFAQGGTAWREVYPVKLHIFEDGALHPITQVNRGRPAPGGSRKRLDEEAPVFAFPAREFHPGRITFHDLVYLGPVVETEGMILVTGLSQRFLARVEADRNLRDCFAVLLIEDRSGSFKASWVSLGNLRRNRKREFTIKFDQEDWKERQTSLLLFSEGLEVPTNRRFQPSHLSAEANQNLVQERRSFLARQEKIQASGPAQLIVSPRPQLRGAVVHGDSVRLTANINPEGIIEDLAFAEVVPESLGIAILRDLVRTRAFPATQEGKPVPARLDLNIPLY